MPIHLKLSSTLRDHVPGYDPSTGLHLDPNGLNTAEDVAEKLGLPLEDIQIVMLNGRHASLESPLRDGDSLAFFPAVGGG